MKAETELPVRRLDTPPRGPFLFDSDTDSDTDSDQKFLSILPSTDIIGKIRMFGFGFCHLEFDMTPLPELFERAYLNIAGENIHAAY